MIKSQYPSTPKKSSGILLILNPMRILLLYNLIWINPPY